MLAVQGEVMIVGAVIERVTGAEVIFADDEGSSDMNLLWPLDVAVVVEVVVEVVVAEFAWKSNPT